MDIEQKILTYLFAKGEPVSHTELAKYFGITAQQCADACASVHEKLRTLGLALINDGKEVELRTAPEMSELVEQIRKDEYGRDIGKAGIETLAIVLYKGASSRSEIDYIRGVNSSHILRALSMRGLLRRITHPKDERSFLYEPTTELLAHLGVGKREDLPEFAAVTAELTALEEVAQQPGESEEHHYVS